MDIDALRAALERATGGEWQVSGTRHKGDLKIGHDTRLHAIGPDGDAVAMVFFDMKTGRGLADAKAIVLAINALRQPGALELLALLNGPDDATVERVAPIIFDAMLWAANQGPPPSSVRYIGGNSDGEEMARDTARAALAAVKEAR